MECRPSPTSKFIYQWERTLKETGTLVSEISKYPEVFMTEDAIDRVRDSFCRSLDKSIWQTRFGEDYKLTEMLVDVTVQITSEWQHQIKTYLVVTAKRSKLNIASDLSRSFLQPQIRISRLLVYRHLGHIGLLARRRVKCVLLTASHCRQWLACSRECVMFEHHYSGLV
ncbi:hypothetical protein TNCV_3212201 [Trichonephila clavipes]|nr:hypothetical protein TNCV_3212201 [Trichonephila clavipes]